jgi:arginyl-tRNA synthetase
VLRQALQSLVESAVLRLVEESRLPEAVRDVPVEIQDTKNPDHGDFACNFAMVASKKAGMNPRQIGELLREAVLAADGLSVFRSSGVEISNPPVAGVDVAGPGFLNLKLTPEAITAFVPEVLRLGVNLSKTRKTERPNDRVNVEFVSVNPNGPITVGSGRGAAFGDTLSRVLEAAGAQVDREYYINDGVNSEQMRQFAASVQALALGQPLPEKAYRGEYVQDVANRVKELQPDVADRDLGWWQSVSQDLMIERQRGDLAAFEVEFTRWFSEQSLHNEGKVASAMEKLERDGVAYRASKAEEAEEDEPNASTPETSEGEALWLRSTQFGDDKDRVLVRADGRPAYIAADVSYLEDKLGTRAYDKALLILGPDHHGYIGRMYAAYQALGYPVDAKGKPTKFEIVIFQIVRFVKDGKPAPMRKRDGNIYELRDLIDELGKAQLPNGTPEEQRRVGADVSRFFYLMRSHDTHMDFDIDLATKQSDENPVFYVQYAHARICSVIRKAEEAHGTTLAAQGSTLTPDILAELTHPRELALVKKILDLPTEVERCAKDFGVHRLTTYAVELARTYHHFYDACRVIQADQPKLTRARLALCEASRLALQSTLDLLGVSAPQRMERAEPAAQS